MASIEILVTAPDECVIIHDTASTTYGEALSWLRSKVRNGTVGADDRIVVGTRLYQVVDGRLFRDREQEAFE